MPLDAAGFRLISTSVLAYRIVVSTTAVLFVGDIRSSTPTRASPSSPRSRTSRMIPPPGRIRPG